MQFRLVTLHRRLRAGCAFGTLHHAVLEQCRRHYLSICGGGTLSSSSCRRVAAAPSPHGAGWTTRVQAARCTSSHHDGPPSTSTSVGPTPAQLRPTMEAQTVSSVDAFARPRVVQYLKRLPVVATPWIGGPQNVEQLLMGAYDATTAAHLPVCFVSRIVIPIALAPPPILEETGGLLPFESWVATEAQEGRDILVATGISMESRAVADSMAAMHAERLLDATGRCLYVVGVAQRRHAMQRRQEGHYAPLPGDPIRSLSVDALPLPLLHQRPNSVDGKQVDAAHVKEVISMLPRRPMATAADKNVARATLRPHPHHSKHQLTEQRGRNIEQPGAGGACPPQHDDETEGMRYMLCNVNTSRIANALIITSPALIDPNSTLRVSRALFSGSTAAFDAHVHTQSEASGDAAMTTCTFPLGAVLAKLLQQQQRKQQQTAMNVAVPSDLVAKGKASTRERAVQLCGMHAELLLYRYQVPIYPEDPEKQRLYDRMAENMGWVGSLCGPYAPVPLPIKELHPNKNEYNYRLSRRAPLSNEEKFLRFHGEAFNHCKTIVPIHATRMSFIIPGFETLQEAEAALESFQRRLRMRALQFIVSGGGEFRTTLLLYNLEVGAQLARSEALRGHATPDDEHCDKDKQDAPPYLVDDTPLLVADASGRRRVQANDCPLLPIAALGVASSLDVSRTLCVLHALEQLNAMNLPVFLTNRERQRAYAEARRLLGMHAPVEEQWGAVPVQSRILRQSAIDGEIMFQEKRESGGRHGATPFTVALAYSPTPSFLQDDRRGCLPPPPLELRSILHLHTLQDFQPIADEKAQEMAILYHPHIQAHIRLWTAGSGSVRCPAGRHGSGSGSGAVPLVFHSVVEDQGSGWRHRSSVWLHLVVKEGGVRKDVVAVGRGTRLVEAERACLVHAAMLLAHHQTLWLPSARTELTAKHEAFMRSVGRVGETAPRNAMPNMKPGCSGTPRRPHVAGSAGCQTSFRNGDCLPIVMQSTFDAMRAHARLYGEMRRAAGSRGDAAAGCGILLSG